MKLASSFLSKENYRPPWRTHSAASRISASRRGCGSPTVRLPGQGAPRLPAHSLTGFLAQSFASLPLVLESLAHSGDPGVNGGRGRAAGGFARQAETWAPCPSGQGREHAGEPSLSRDPRPRAGCGQGGRVTGTWSNALRPPRRPKDPDAGCTPVPASAAPFPGGSLSAVSVPCRQLRPKNIKQKMPEISHSYVLGPVPSSARSPCTVPLSGVCGGRSRPPFGLRDRSDCGAVGELSAGRPEVPARRPPGQERRCRQREAAPRPRGGPTPPAEGSVRSVVPGTHWGAWNLPPTDERGRSGEPSHVLRAAEPPLPRESVHVPK